MTETITDFPKLALAWHREGRGVAIATVVQTWGSAPRPVGSQLVIDASGAMEGSVSGGCVEGAVILESQEAIIDGRPRVLTFGVSDDDAFAVGLACGGEIRILVEPVGTVLPIALLERLVTLRARFEPVAYVTDLETPAPRLVGLPHHADRFRLDRSGVAEDGRTFVAIHNPPLRLVIVGAVHIAQPLVAMAHSCGYQPVVVDPRAAFATGKRFPETTLVDDWPDAALRALNLDRRTAVVTLSHDPKLDDPALITALDSDAFYIGSLGSKRTHAKRVARLAEAGFSESQVARIYGPIGLDLGGRQPAEIAVSIMAQVTQILRKSD
ncbi:XdhC/CoxI family protein [Loktanella sp. D2R18]|uniref:XdhC family protein n=1 Tax=Rhodobacterales TaxID=204455 RepID=UPI000DEB363A|nr:MULTISPECIES: XdhC family protein [Rhodobacterales]MDO6591874.1 XdhC family protein [Yoonia sp. 1_MG-2023]RBW44829.1 XdhC/CoxI family protein [Loktanella sp. D2R18]